MNEKSLKLLEQYDIEVTGTRRGRGSYLCETPLGTKLFADYTGSETKLARVNRVLERMEENGYTCADKVLATREGKLMTEDRDGNTCVLKDWYEGRECDPRSMADIVQASTSLARLHRMMTEPEEGEIQNSSGELLTELWRRHNRELCKIHTYIRKRKNRTEFEQKFLQAFGSFYRQAEEAEQRLADSSFEMLYRKSRNDGCLCHGNYTQHNIYFLSRRKIFTANFDRCSCDIQAADLYQFMRKILEKQDWSVQTGHRMLEAYSSEKTLSREELEYLQIRLGYPEKFWKLANQYYNCSKSCISPQFARKLERLISQERQKNGFLRTL